MRGGATKKYSKPCFKERLTIQIVQGQWVYLDRAIVPATGRHIRLASKSSHSLYIAIQYRAGFVKIPLRYPFCFGSLSDHRNQVTLRFFHESRNNGDRFPCTHSNTTIPIVARFVSKESNDEPGCRIHDHSIHFSFSPHDIGTYLQPRSAIVWLSAAWTTIEEWIWGNRTSGGRLGASKSQHIFPALNISSTLPTYSGAEPTSQPRRPEFSKRRCECRSNRQWRSAAAERRSFTKQLRSLRSQFPAP